MPNPIEVVITSKNDSKKGFDAAERDATKFGKGVQEAGQKADKALKGIDDSAARAGKSLEEAGRKSEGFGSKLKTGVGEQAGGAAEGLMDKLGPIGGVLQKLGPVGLAAGAAIGAGLAAATLVAGKLKEALDASIARTKAAALAGAQGLGTDPASIKNTAKLAGKIYGENFGESIDEATRSVRDVLRNNLVPKGAGDELVKTISEKLLVLGQIAEDDTAHIATAIQTMLRTGLAKSADEAIDVLTAGFQRGADKANDLIDTLVEYPVQFKKLGLSAQEATGLLVQGLNAGARNADLVADALKEFTIRAVDGSKLTAEGFKLIGVNGKQMAADIAAGGPRAERALQTVLDRMRAMKNPIDQTTASVDLFGTKSEDLQAALLALDPKHATDALGNVQGAADRASKALSDAAPWTEQLNRKWEELKQNVGDRLMPTFNKLGEWLGKFWQKIAPSVRDALDYIKQKFEENRPGLEKFVTFLKDMAPYAEAAAKVLIAVLAGSIGIVIDTLSALGDGWEKAKQFTLEFTNFILDKFGVIVHGAADAFGWIPGIGPQLKEAAARFDKFAGEIRDKINGIPSQKLVEVHAYLTGGEAVGNALANLSRYVSSGIGVRGHASGGIAGGLSRVAERGGELLDLPQGTRVWSSANSNQMAGQASGGTTQISLALESSGGGSGDALTEVINTLINNNRLRLKVVNSRVVPA